MVGTAQATETPLAEMSIFLWEDVEGRRTTITIWGLVDPDTTELPATVSFQFLEGFTFKQLNGFNIETLEHKDDIEPETKLVDGSIEYTFTLSEDFGFFAGFEIPGGVFEVTPEMGNTPLGHFAFIPPNDLEALTVGFVSPSPELVGAGTDVYFLIELEEGELYGITRTDVSGGEVQEFTIAFGSRAARDEALAAAAEAEAAAAEAQRRADDPWYRFTSWLTSPIGLITSGGAVIVIAVTAIVVVLLINQRSRGTDDDDSDNDADDVPGDVPSDDADDKADGGDGAPDDLDDGDADEDY